MFLFLGQQTTVNGQQTSCTVPEPVEVTTLGASTSSATAYTRTVDCCPLSVDFYESQIRIADSLYKNYLPQSNFEEVKAAMEFFDSHQPSAISGQRWRFFDSYQPSAISGQRWRLFDKEADDENRLIAESRQLTAAKAHYYHAVGLTEKDDIVGACEHYLIALEIMEPLVETSPQLRLMANDKRQKTKGKGLCDSASLRLCDSNKEDYEKIRFVALIYTRLGKIFLNESCCNLAIVNYKNALLFSNELEDNMFKSNTMKYIGNAYQLYSKQDSALLYYRKSLEYNNSIANKLDVEKCIAQILYYKGERDCALMMLRNNLNKIDNKIVKYAYHHTLGNMFYKDNAYDSALYYLEESLEDSIIIKKLAFTTTLSSIYDSLGNYAKKAYYDNLSSKLFFDNINKEVDKSKLQTLYNNYNERKSEKISIEAKARTRRITMISCLGAIITIMFVFILRCNYKKQNDKLKGEINDYAKENKRLIDNFKKSNDKKDKIIKQQKKEISEIKNQFNNATGFNLEAYYDSDICKKILSRKDSDFSSLKEDELALLLKSANLYLNNISVRLREQFPTLNHNDIYTICLIILNVEKNKLPHLLSRDRKTIWDRLDKIRRLMKIDAKQDLFIHIRDNYLH